jgi:DNA excision repair protein ERCC-3
VSELGELSSESVARKKTALEETGAALAPVTIAASSYLARHEALLEKLARESFGLLVIDEVHLLPEPLLRWLERVQHRRRLGLTATLGREDGRERPHLGRDLFALVGPRLSSVPWKLLERQGWIAEALCAEVKVPLAPAARLAYLQAPAREQPLLAAENPAKLTVLERLLERHRREPLLVLGSHLDLLEQAAALANAPLVSGSSRARERESLFADFRSGKLRRLVLSKVGSHAVDLPEAQVAIQLSGTFGSRQEEAQRLGRILRPKESGAKARFYALVSEGTVEEEHAHRRQLFLTEQGYRYAHEDGFAGDGLAGGGLA